MYNKDYHPSDLMIAKLALGTFTREEREERVRTSNHIKEGCRRCMGRYNEIASTRDAPQRKLRWRGRLRR